MPVNTVRHLKRSLSWIRKFSVSHSGLCLPHRFQLVVIGQQKKPELPPSQPRLESKVSGVRLCVQSPKIWLNLQTKLQAARQSALFSDWCCQQKEKLPFEQNRERFFCFFKKENEHKSSYTCRNSQHWAEQSVQTKKDKLHRQKQPANSNS